MPVRVKICGVTTPEDVRLCVACGADAIGVNFFSRSPRFVEPARALPLLRCLSPFVEPVGVFVQQPLRQAAAIAYQLGLSCLQWQVDEPTVESGDPFRLVTVFRIRDVGSVERMRAYLERCREAGTLPAAVLVDAFVDGQLGGTGHPAPWELLANLRLDVPLILAGGLKPENVAEAIRIVRPYGVDVASGVESAPGRKDADKLRRFIDAVRSVG